MYNGKTVSVVMSTYNEKDSIKNCISRFLASDFVDEVIVVDNNAVDGTCDEVQETNAKIFHEPKQGYGYGFQKALRKATGDMLIMCEPDGTFYPEDLLKFLAYTDCMEMVQGSRTNATMIFNKANMGLFLKYGNYFVAKLAEFLFLQSAPNLSDCGCTFRLMTRKAYTLIQPMFRQRGSAFGLEITLLALRTRIPMCQIPIRYDERVGKSSVTGSFWKAFLLGLHMIGLIFFHFLEDKVHPFHSRLKWIP